MLLTNPPAAKERPELLWPAATGARPISADEVHVWACDLSEEADLCSLESLLSCEERTRACRFVFKIDRKRYTVAHGSLRRILAGYLNCTPEELRFAQNERGKPILIGNHANELQFNLTHSNDLALLALSPTSEVGVDVELIRPISADVAKRFFSEYEQQRLQQSNIAEWCESFFTCWTRKEAFLKGVGFGLTIPLNSFDVSVGTNEPARLVSVRDGHADKSAWIMEHLAPAVGYLGALAVSGQRCATKLFSFHMR